MSWLKPGNITPSDYDPQERVEAFNAQKGEIAEKIRQAFNRIDPLKCFYGDDVNPDEYLGYVSRFLNKFGQKDFNSLSEEEIADFIRVSFHPGQIGKFAQEEDIVRLIDKVKGLRIIQD